MFNPLTIVLATLFGAFLICIGANDETSLPSDSNNQTLKSLKAKSAISTPFTERHGGRQWKSITVMVTISSTSVAIMIVIVVTYITVQYMRNRRIENAERADQCIPMYTEPAAFNVDSPMPRSGTRR